MHRAFYQRYHAVLERGTTDPLKSLKSFVKFRKLKSSAILHRPQLQQRILHSTDLEYELEKVKTSYRVGRILHLMQIGNPEGRLDETQPLLITSPILEHRHLHDEFETCVFISVLSMCEKFLRFTNILCYHV
jgi:hypothetical protein